MFHRSVIDVGGAVALAAALLLPAAPAQAVGDTIGRVISVAGEVTASVPGGGTRVLQRRARIYTEEVIHTGAGERVQIRFRDGGLVDLQPRTRFRVDEYQARSEDSGGSVLMNLLTGALRTITGAIGDGADDIYRMETPVATIGVRGTQYALQYCAADCAGGEAARGLFGRVDHGSITVTNAWGTRSFGRTRFFRVRSSDSAPTGILQPPGDVLQQGVSPAGEGGADEEGPLTGGSEGDRLDGTDATAETSGYTTAGETVPLDTGESEYTSSNDAVDPALEPLDGVAAGGLVGKPSSSQVPSAQGGLASVSGTATEAFIDGQGRMSRVEFGPSASIDASGTSHVESGALPALATTWGRWQGKVVVSDETGTSTVDGSFPYAYSTNPTTSAEVGNLSSMATTVTYSLAGGPQATDTAGNVWSVTTLTLDVNFSDQVVSGAIAMDNGTTTLGISQTGITQDLSSGTLVLPAMQGNWSDGVTGGTASGYLQGVFVGDQAEGALVGFQARQEDVDGLSIEEIQGVKLLKR